MIAKEKYDSADRSTYEILYTYGFIVANLFKEELDKMNFHFESDRISYIVKLWDKEVSKSISAFNKNHIKLLTTTRRGAATTAGTSALESGITIQNKDIGYEKIELTLSYQPDGSWLTCAYTGISEKYVSNTWVCEYSAHGWGYGETLEEAMKMSVDSILEKVIDNVAKIDYKYMVSK
jgi:hypothetical protein